MSKEGWRLISELVEVKDESLKALVHSWLNGVYLLDDGKDPELERSKLGANECLLNKLGDIYSINTLSINAAQSSLNGVLERQRELSELNKQLPTIKAAVDKIQTQLFSLEQGLQDSRYLQQQQQQNLTKVTQTQHHLNVEVQKLQQQRQHVLDRQTAVQQDIANKQLEIARENKNKYDVKEKPTKK
jgi:chromosome segregation protein